MKTRKIFILTAFFLAVGFSCTTEDVLEITPDIRINAEEVFQDEKFARAYLANVYDRMPLQPFNRNFAALADQATLANGSRPGYDAGDAAWDYALIRDINVFIEEMTKSSLDDAVKSQMIGEARVLRAYIYYEMQIRWGGVPLVDAVIDPFGEIDEQYAKRSTEEAIADFIDTELTAAAGMLSDDPEPKGMVNKWSALALKARANLWAASIARYSTVQLDGLVGIPASRADEFFTKASEAAKTVIESQHYSLYNELPADKSENYRQIFMDEGNSEVILERPYDGINAGHSYDEYCQLNHLAARGGFINPILEFIMGYENIDGSTDQPQFGTGNLYADGREPFLKKDPRLFGTVFFEGESWAGSTVQTYEATDPNVVPDPSALLTNMNSFYQGRREAGLDSRNGPKPQEATKSGFIAKKYIDDTQTFLEAGESSTNWIIFRLAEMYLIRAEAELELGNTQPAADALNWTRQRAGITTVDASTITLDKVRTERRYELAFEQQRFWDLRRWRIAESVLSGFVHGLQIVYHAPSAEYYFIEIQAEPSSRSFESRDYYNAITQGRINNNPLLIENPGYN